MVIFNSDCVGGSGNTFPLPIDDGVLYIAIVGHAQHTVTEFSDGVTNYFITQDPSGVFSASATVPNTLILKPDHFPSIDAANEDTTGTDVAINFFQDTFGFNLSFRGTSGANKRVELWLQDVPYDVIPSLTLPVDWAYETGPNPGAAGFNHLFIGEIAGFGNVNITGGSPSPQGSNVPPRIFREVF